MTELRKIDEDNIWKVVTLSVNDNQRNFVATNTQSILEAYLTVVAGKTALPFGIYDDDTLIGFVMYGYGTTGDEDEPSVSKDSYCIWRFMVDKNYQGKGLGKKAFQAVLDYLKTEPCGHAEYCWLSYEPENVVARSLYKSFGFEENGELCGDEIVAVKKL